MRNYNISYWSCNAYHESTVEAKNEYEAINQALNDLPDIMKRSLSDFEIEKSYE